MANEYQPASADALARLHAREAVGAIVEVMRNRDAAPEHRLRAAALLLDRGHGKPTQAVVTVPATRANAARLAGMTTAALLAIVQRAQGGGGIPPNEGPNTGGQSEGNPSRGTPQSFAGSDGRDADSDGRDADSDGIPPIPLTDGDTVFPEQQRDASLEQIAGSPRPGRSRFETDDMIDVDCQGGIPQNEGPKARRSTKETPTSEANQQTAPSEEVNPWD